MPNIRHLAEISASLVPAQGLTAGSWPEAGTTVQGRSLTDFVAEALREAAQTAVEGATLLRLSMEDPIRFADALLAPPEPNAALRRAFARRKRLEAK